LKKSFLYDDEFATLGHSSQILKKKERIRQIQASNKKV